MRSAAVFTAGLVAAMLVATGCSSDKSLVSGAGTAAANGGNAGAASVVSAPAATSGSAAGQTTASAPASVPASSSGGGGGGGGSLNVCSLLPTSQASTINKVTYSGATPKAITNGYDECTYKNSGQHASPIDIQDLTVMVISIPGCWSGLQSADGPGTAVAGIGDAAFGDSIGLDVKLGSRCLTISGLTIAELQNDYAPDTAMAKIIVANLH